MSNRQAVQWSLAAVLILWLSGCAPAPALPPTATALPDTATPLPSPTFTPGPTATPTPPACLSQPGRLGDGVLDTTKPPQQYMFYLPPCYDQRAEVRYPVLYLLHGQTYTDDQWARLGAVQAADELILSGEAPPFIMIFPDDRYWNLQSGAGFGTRLVDSLIPYIDKTYRTLDDREHRALGGLSRGGGWTVKLGLTHPELFGILGLHSPAVFKEDASHIAGWMAAIPHDEFPRLWLDVGDHDKELGYARLLENILSTFALDHEFHVYSGDHTEAYWGRHVQEYLRWYAEAWQVPPGG